MKRSPFRDSRSQKIMHDPRQTTDLKVFNFPMTELLRHCRTHASCTINIDTDDESWILDCQESSDGPPQAVINIFNNKQFVLDTTDQCIKLSGPGSDSLNMVLKCVLKLLNTNASDDQIKERCKTINKKIVPYLGAHEQSKVPIELLEHTYENCINSIEVDRSKVAKSPRKRFVVTSPKKEETTAHPSPLEYEHNDNVFKLSIPDDFALAPSKYIYDLTGKTEYGIFTKKKIKKNQIIGSYTGITFISKDNDTYDDLFRRCYERNCREGSFLMKNDKYDMLVNKKIIDSSVQRKGSFLRYINSGFPNYYMNNCAYDRYGLCTATRDISPGEELLCSYGINTESNIREGDGFIVFITGISPPGDSMTVNYVELLNDNTSNEKTMAFDAFLERYYEILDLYLINGKKYKLYQSYIKTKKPIAQEKKYTVQELNGFKDTEISLFLQRIKEKLDSLSEKKLSGLKERHYNQLKDYYENKKTKI